MVVNDLGRNGAEGRDAPPCLGGCNIELSEKGAEGCDAPSSGYEHTSSNHTDSFPAEGGSNPSAGRGAWEIAPLHHPARGPRLDNDDKDGNLGVKPVAEYARFRYITSKSILFYLKVKYHCLRNVIKKRTF